MKKAQTTILILIAHLLTLNLDAQTRDYWPNNGWKTKSPNTSGMDTTLLIRMDSAIQASMNYINAFLIVKNGYLVYEKYFNGYNMNQYHHLWSATKSVTNIMMGIMFKKKYITDIHCKIIDFFPEYSTINADPRIKDITLEHLMAFTAGLYSKDSEAYAAPSIDALKYYLGNTFQSDPGIKFKYATPASHIQSALITKIRGITEKEMAVNELFPKLGIDSFDWITDIKGYSYGGHNSFFSPRDMLKFGFLYLNNGIWNGDTIVDPEFVKTSTTIHTNGGSPHYEKYGYNWWITTNNGYFAYFAGGYGGQFIYVVPELDLVVAITCNSDTHRENARFLINSYVVPSIISKLNSGIQQKNTIGKEIKIYPNPARDKITISFQTNTLTNVQLYITDVSGKSITYLINNKKFKAGYHSLDFNISLAPGIYMVHGQIGKNSVKSKNLVITMK